VTDERDPQAEKRFSSKTSTDAETVIKLKPDFASANSPKLSEFSE
jgi:hypothetical protein